MDDRINAALERIRARVAEGETSVVWDDIMEGITSPERVAIMGELARSENCSVTDDTWALALNR